MLEEGYDYSIRAYTFRKTGADRVRLTMKPRAPQINPVFLFNGWTSPEVQVTVDGQPLERGRYQAQVSGQDLTVWVDGRFAEETKGALRNRVAGENNRQPCIIRRSNESVVTR